MEQGRGGEGKELALRGVRLATLMPRDCPNPKHPLLFSSSTQAAASSRKPPNLSQGCDWNCSLWAQVWAREVGELHAAGASAHPLEELG